MKLKTKGRKKAIDRSNLSSGIVIEFMDELGVIIGTMATSIEVAYSGDFIEIIGCNRVIFDERICALVPLDQRTEINNG